MTSTTNANQTTTPTDADMHAMMNARAIWINMANGTEWMIGLWNFQCEHITHTGTGRAYDMDVFIVSSKGIMMDVGRDHPILIKWSDMARVDVIPMTFKGVN